MDITQYRASIVRPISAESPVGERLLDEPLFDFVEDQMMKVGSLSHASVQWQEVEHSTVTLLNEKSKDIKLLVYLLQCLHHQLTPKRLITSFGVMSDFITHYWQDCFPAPGKRGNLPRRKFFSQICQRFSLAVDKFDFATLDSQDREELQQTVQEWQAVLEDNELSSDVAESVVVTIVNQLTRAQEREKVAQAAQQQPAAPTSTSSTSSSSLAIDNSSDKAAKQTLLKVAEYLSEQEFSGALAIRVRRHALWGAITTLPDHDHQGQTLLRGMQTERVKEYQDHLHQPDLALWRRVEQSLTIAPYWFEGQLMSHDIAKALGQEGWCKAIIEETQAFIERFPTVVELKFKGGAPFISDAVREWLTAYQGGAAAVSGSGSWQEQRDEAFSLAKEGGIAVAMSMLNDGLVAATEPRDRFYWRLLSADLLKHNHLDAMAKEQYQTLKQEITQTSVTQWEPSLIEQLERNTASD
ncbi:type VI secretion system protein TssA [Vibrio pacinii]|uniref:type VI secretion system protein TssA n=1 Tax=Vibrio pacinii TaxID=170674 RepID=UPI00056EE79A|nr:type VI secretion system protein TssA [Vibrio pacinii]